MRSTTHDPITETPTGKGPRWRRRLLRALLLCSAIAALAAVLLWLGLRSPRFRQEMLQRASDALEDATGVRAQAEDFSLQMTRGRLVISKLQVAAEPWDRDLLQAERAIVEVEWLPLLRRRVVLRLLQIDSPRIDLAAPRPPATEKRSGGGETKFTLQQLRILDATLLPAPPAADAWLQSWRLEGIDAEGSYVQENVQLQLLRATLRGTVAEGPPIVAEATARLRGPPSGPLQIEELRLVGEGLSLEADGELGLGPDDPLAIRFTLLAQGDKILPRLASGSRLEATGEVDLRHLSGHARIFAQRLPVALLEPWLGRHTIDNLGIAGSRLDLKADLSPASTAEGQGEQIRIVAELAWRRSSTQAADATGRPLVPELLSGQLNATLGRQAGSGLPDLRSLNGELHLEARELPAEMATPWLPPDLFRRLGGAGSQLDFAADLHLDPGGLLEPGSHPQTDGAERMAATVDFTWRRDSTTLLQARLESAATSQEDAAELRFNARLLPRSAEEIALEGTLVAPPWQRLGTEEFVPLRDSNLQDTVLRLRFPDIAASLGRLAEYWPELLPEERPELPGSLQATAHLTGPLANPRADLDARWLAGPGSELRLQATAASTNTASTNTASTNAAWTPAGVGTLSSQGFDLSLLNLGLSGQVSGSFQVAGDGQGIDAEADLELTQLESTEAGLLFDHLAFKANLDDQDIALHQIAGGRRDLTFSGLGHLTLDRGAVDFIAAQAGELREPLSALALDLDLRNPWPGVESAKVLIALHQGRLRVAVPDLQSSAGSPRLEVEIPLASLAAIPQLADTLDSLPCSKAEGPIHLEFAFPALDTRTLLPLLDIPQRQERLRANLAGELRLDLAQPSLAEGQITLTDLDVEAQDHRLQVEDLLRFDLAQGQVELHPTTLFTDGRPLQLASRLKLAPEWRLQDPPRELIQDLSCRLNGSLEAALLSPYMPTGFAEGALHIDLDVRGPLDALEGSASILGPEATVYIPQPYSTRLEELHADISIVEGLLMINSAGGRLNEGPLEIQGTVESNGEVDLRVTFTDVRHRVDYGLDLVSAGDLRLRLPQEGQGQLQGEVQISRGLLRRNLNLEKELLETLFGPPPLASSDPDDPLSGIDVDLKISLRDGIRVKNNLADLNIAWQPLSLRGTLAQPVLEGQVDIRPGGLLFLPGQNLRIDRGSLTFPGLPGAEPELDFSTTSSLENPSIGSGRRVTPFDTASRSQGLDKDPQEADLDGLQEGLGGYYGGRLAESVLGGRFSARPVYIFGETDPGARLTLSREFSSHVALAVSLNLRESGQRTYILDLHDFRALPSLSAKIFTKDARNPTEPNDEGLTLEQSLELGKRRVDRHLPRLAGLRLEGIENLPERKLRRATPLKRGSPLLEGSAFDLELDLGDALRRMGYPGAEISVRAEPLSGQTQRQILVASIDPGPRVAIAFSGETIPRRQESAISELYQSGFFESASLEDMRQQAEKTLQAQGFLQPQIEIEVHPLDPSQPEGDRQVRVDSQGGRQVNIKTLRISGLDAADREALARRYPGRAERIQLVLDRESAEKLLLRDLAGLGFPHAEISSLELDASGNGLSIEVATGPRRRLAAIDITGLDSNLTSQLRPGIALQPGDPLRQTTMARAAFGLEQALRQRGYAQARVRPHLSEHDAAWQLTLQVERGPIYRIQEILFSGLHKIRPKRARKVAGLQSGDLLGNQALAKAREHLFALGTFSRVEPSSSATDTGETTVRFDVDERARFNLSYGLRWSTQEKVQAVVDVVDRNAFGRAITLGARALFKRDDERLIGLVRMPRLFGTAASLGLFVEDRELVEDDFIDTRQEATLQISIPFGEHADGRLYGRYRRQRVRDVEPDPFFPIDDTIRSPILGLQWVYDDRNDLWQPRRGVLASVDLSTADESIGSDFAFLRLLGKLAIFRPAGRIASRRLTWAQSYQIGWARPLRGQTLLRRDRFFAGGELSIRGYPEGEAGPLESLGLVVRPAGGESLLVINQELRLPLWGLFSGVAFFDAGNVWEDGDFGSDLLTSVGLGLRADTPLGLLRLDLARPLDRREGERDFELYFGFGNTF